MFSFNNQKHGIDRGDIPQKSHMKMHDKEVPVIESLEELIKILHEIFAEDNVNIDYVNAVLGAYKSNPKDWKQYGKFDVHRYTRNLIDRGNGKFNLMALCWSESQASSIHDHADSHCFVKVLDGTLRESMYDWPSDTPTAEGENQVEEANEMVPKNIADYHKNGVAYINDSMGLHRMENPSNTDRCVTMHLYCPPFDSCKVFDERSGKSNSVKVTFWSEYGKRTPFSSAGCSSTPENN